MNILGIEANYSRTQSIFQNESVYEKSLLLEKKDTAYSSFCRLIHKENSYSQELLDCYPTQQNAFYKTVFKEEFKRKDIQSQETTAKLFLYIFITSFSFPTAKNKFDFVKTVLQNKIIDQGTKDLFFDAFCSAQQHYWRLNRLVSSYKFKRMTVHCSTDLYLRPISPTDKDVIQIVQNNQKYIFTTQDIYKLLFSSITHGDMQYFELLEMKNPYNNLPFDHGTLYHIYFFLKKRLLVLPELIHQFFLCGFDLNLFEQKNETLLSHTMIEEFLHSNDNVDEKCRFIRQMFRYSSRAIMIHEEFPKERLIEITKPYLRIYLHSRYNLDTSISERNRLLLRRKLERFYKFNPRFGRKQIILHPFSAFEFQHADMGSEVDIKKKNTKISVVFNDSHVEFLHP